MGVATGILSGLAAFMGTLLVYYCALAKNQFEFRAYTELIDENCAPSLQPALKLVGTTEDALVQFRIHNLTPLPVILPRPEFFPPRFRSWRGDWPSSVVEMVDGRGRRQPYSKGWRSCAAEGPLTLTAADFIVVPPGGSVPWNHPMLSWTPPQPGTYTFRMALDTRWKSLGDWGENTAAAARPLLRGMPQGVFVSEAVTVVFTP